MGTKYEASVNLSASTAANRRMRLKRIGVCLGLHLEDERQRGLHAETVGDLQPQPPGAGLARCPAELARPLVERDPERERPRPHREDRPAARGDAARARDAGAVGPAD